MREQSAPASAEWIRILQQPIIAFIHVNLCRAQIEPVGVAETHVMSIAGRLAELFGAQRHLLQLVSAVAPLATAEDSVARWAYGAWKLADESTETEFKRSQGSPPEQDVFHRDEWPVDGYQSAAAVFSQQSKPFLEWKGGIEAFWLEPSPPPPPPPPLSFSS